MMYDYKAELAQVSSRTIIIVDIIIDQLLVYSKIFMTFRIPGNVASRQTDTVSATNKCDDTTKLFK